MIELHWMIQQINGTALAGFTGDVATELVYECRAVKGDLFRSEYGVLPLQPPSAEDFIPAAQLTKELAAQWLIEQMPAQLMSQIEATAAAGLSDSREIGATIHQPLSLVMPTLPM